jgi:hypothetical protein
MEGKLPEIYWYVFWCAVFLISMGAMIWGGRNTHKLHMKTLEIMRIYAEKGIEPPPSIMEPLARQILDPHKQQAKQQATGQAVLLGKFIGGMSAAALTAGIGWWWHSEAYQPTWIVYAAGIVAIGAAVGAISQLIAAIVTRDK